MPLRQLTEIALAIALAAVLDIASKSFPVPRLMQGGSVSLQMLPIFIVAFRHGWRLGVTAGACYGVVNFLLDMYVVHPIQVPLDYPIAFGLVGFAGLGHPLMPQRGPEMPVFSLGVRLRLAFWVGLGEGLRFLAHFVSGIVFWSQNAPAGQPVWLYSLGYNATYMIPETIIDILLLQLILRRILSYSS